MMVGAAVNTGDVSGQRNRADSVAISVAGGLRTGVAYVLDGAMHNDPYDNTNMPFPFPDALQEFSVATGGLSAQNGMHSAAAVNAVTRSGTNALHGKSVRVPARTINSIRPRNLPRWVRTARRRATASSAISSAARSAGRSCATSCSSSAGSRGRSSGRRRRRTSPSCRLPAMLAGDFTGLASPACNAGRQVALRAPFVNNRINPALFSQAAVTISKRLPVTNDPCGEIRYSVPLDNNDKQIVTRIDHQFSANHSIFGRYIDHVREPAADAVADRQHPDGAARVRRQQAGARPVDGARRHDGVRRQHGQRVPRSRGTARRTT